MSEDRLEITVHFKDGEFPRELVINRAGREVDHVTMDGERLEDVVRCEDCAHFSLGYGGRCQRLLKGPLVALVEPDGFCAWGEPGEVDE